MAHYAKVFNGVVSTVIVADQEYIDTYNNPEDTVPGDWVQCSFNTRDGKHYDPETGLEDDGVPFRHNFPSHKWNYDANAEVFYERQPYLSWTLNSNWRWEAPVAQPNVEDKSFHWDEATTNWIEITGET
jgi:hypothetical protein